MTPTPHRRRRILLWLAGTALVVFLALQLVRPELPNPPVTADFQAPADVKQIVRHSCYNCHSNETKLWWYDQIVPAYWLVAGHVKQARAHLNFSDFGALPPAQQKGTLFEAVNQVQLGAMPLPSYTMVHPDAVMTEAELETLRKYLAPPLPEAAAPESAVAAADTQYTQWLTTGNAPAGGNTQVQPAPNGIEFLPDYKNWRQISSTDRFDNQSIRAVLANDIAVQAIASNHIKPWPDGATFAKVAWLSQPDGKGGIRPGAFFQVEFMIKDSRKYAATLGWGWARWRGTGLKPYGTNAGFAEECTGCHAPLAANDYVYTLPIRGQQ